MGILVFQLLWLYSVSTLYFPFSLHLITLHFHFSDHIVEVSQSDYFSVVGKAVGRTCFLNGKGMIDR